MRPFAVALFLALTACHNTPEPCSAAALTTLTETCVAGIRAAKAEGKDQLAEDTEVTCILAVQAWREKCGGAQ